MHSLKGRYGTEQGGTMANLFLDKARRSELMAAIRSKGTQPELAVRKALHASGFRYRLHDSRLPGKPDIVLPRLKAVVQVRGCFWHGHECRDGHIPKSNKEYWEGKLARNQLRDLTTDAALATMGWRVFIVWECEWRQGVQAILQALRPDGKAP
jgi:DNA mismatch endonuclease (patch repair protein)